MLPIAHLAHKMTAIHAVNDFQITDDRVNGTLLPLDHRLILIGL
jgi:hypothetical protein